VARLESSIESSLRKAWMKRGALVIKINPLGFAGLPDRLVIAPNGMVLWCEVKRVGKEPRPLQVRVMKLLIKWKQWVCWTDNVEDAMMYYDRMLENRRWRVKWTKKR